MEYLRASSVDCFREFFHKTQVQRDTTFITFGPRPDLYFGRPVTSHVACSSSPLPCPLLQHLQWGTSACAACSGLCPTRRFTNTNYVPILRTSCGTTTTNRASHYNAMTHMQRKEKGLRLSSVVYTQCDCHPGFHFTLDLIWGYFDCLFLRSLLNCMPSVLLFVFTARVLHIAEDEPVSCL